MKRFDLDTAMAEFNDAMADWTINMVGSVVGDLLCVSVAEGPDDFSRWLKFQHAAAVLAWESGRVAAQRAFPGPVYDDDTMHQLLAGARG